MPREERCSALLALRRWSLYCQDFEVCELGLYPAVDRLKLCGQTRRNGVFATRDEVCDTWELLYEDWRDQSIRDILILTVGISPPAR